MAPAIGQSARSATNGLLDLYGFDKHFTQMLKSNMFKDLELGEGMQRTLWGGGTTGDGGTAGVGDTMVLTGTFGDHTFERIAFTDAHGNQIFGFKVTDNVGTDGTDLVIGVEHFNFTGDNSTYTAAEVLGGTPAAPVINGGDVVAVAAAENDTAAAVIDVVSTDVVNLTLSGADAARFDIDSAGNLTFKFAPNFELPTDAGGNNVYDVVVTATDSYGQSDQQALAITVSNASEVGNGLAAYRGLHRWRFYGQLDGVVDVG